MKSHIKEAYIELPLKVFMKVYPQYLSDFARYERVCVNLDDSEYIVRMQIRGGQVIVEVGHANDAEWAVGKKGMNQPSEYACMPDPSSYDALSFEDKARYIENAKKYIETVRKNVPGINVSLDEGTGRVIFE